MNRGRLGNRGRLENSQSKCPQKESLLFVKRGGLENRGPDTTIVHFPQEQLPYTLAVVIINCKIDNNILTNYCNYLNESILDNTNFMKENKKPTGIKKLWSASIYSAKGFKACYQSEYAFRLEVWLAVVLTPLGYWLGESPVEKVLLITPIFLVLIVEMLNSAIEAVVDRISLEKHELSGFAKDVASAAVSISLIIFIFTWIIILL